MLTSDQQLPEYKSGHTFIKEMEMSIIVTKQCLILVKSLRLVIHESVGYKSAVQYCTPVNNSAFY